MSVPGNGEESVSVPGGGQEKCVPGGAVRGVCVCPRGIMRARCVSVPGGGWR